MSWMRLKMTEQEMLGDFKDIQESFNAALIAAGSPKKAIMYRSDALEGDDSFYFTPEASELFSETLERRGAVSCPKLDLYKISVLHKVG